MSFSLFFRPSSCGGSGRFTLFSIQLRYFFLLVMFLRTFIAYKTVFLFKTTVPFRQSRSGVSQTPRAPFNTLGLLEPSSKCSLFASISGGRGAGLATVSPARPAGRDIILGHGKSAQTSVGRTPVTLRPLQTRVCWELTQARPSSPPDLRLQTPLLQSLHRSVRTGPKCTVASLGTGL